jgi:hypothetical protein
MGVKKASIFPQWRNNTQIIMSRVKEKFLNGKNGENDKNGGQKKISQLEENHLHKYTEQILASMSQPTTPKTTSSSALFLSGNHLTQ